MRSRLHYLLVFAPLVLVAACTSILGDFSVGGGSDDGDGGNLGDGTIGGDGASNDGSTITDGATGSDAADGGIKCGFPGEACCTGPFAACNDGTKCVSGKCRVSDLFAVGEISFFSNTGESAYYNGTSWVAGPPINLATSGSQSNPTVTGIGSFGVGAYQITTSAGFLMTYNSADPRWRTCSASDAPCPFPTTTQALFGILVFNSSDYWIFGSNVMDHCGSSCVVTNTGLPASLGQYGMAGTSGSDVWLADSDHVYHSAGASWTSTPSVPAYKMWAYSSKDVWAGSGAGLKHFDGVSWSPTYALTLPDGGVAGSVYGLFGTASDDVWAVGYNNTGNIPFTEHWNGAGWTSIPIPAAAGQIDDVWAASRDEAFISGGFSGVVYKWDGAAWTAMTMPPMSAYGDSGFLYPAWDHVFGSAKPRPAP